ncbi:MAG: 3'-5' exonuclease [Lachnoanaerobaculum sp.]|jgi:exonuclease, DNA polymerase III, epsilon subunit family|uniref:3'-5' exonuclease n=1 Tax=Lachnoanaerobaculum sp. TaxID=2049030 RepID=UPI0025BF9AB7|nr:3'-5' exonuclease [Lachnoanaerobaculum sp.]MBS5881473.1 3'-5' exonuclease [Lachnoanaerobaculum sp.]
MIISDYIAIDLETTGIRLSKDKIIEVGLLKVKDSHIIDTFSCVINPDMQVDDKILELTKISKNELENAKRIHEVINHIVDFCEEYVLLGHNTIFDYSFVKKEANRAGLEFEKRGIDTYKLCKKVLPENVRKNLTDACGYFGIERKNSHRAFSDAYYTHVLFQEIIKNFKTLEISSEAMKVKIKKFVSIRKRTKEDLQKLLNCHRIGCKVNIDLLSESEAKRMMDKIKSGSMDFT